jgi:hypothetical protein
MDMKDFKLVIAQMGDASEENKGYVEAAYRMWDEVWREALQELDETTYFPSDDFTRHKEVTILCHESTPVGSVSYTPVDLSMEMWRRDSYFKVWPESLLNDLAQNYPGRKILVGCYFTLAKQWRRDAHGISAKRLMLALAVQHVVHSKCAIMVGTMRANRSMHTVSYEMGATPLVKGTQHHGVDVDLLIWKRDEIQKDPNPNQYMLWAKEIYSRAENLSSPSRTARVAVPFKTAA